MAGMDDSSLEMLEFPKIREILAGYTSFSASRELALNLKPSVDPDIVSLLLQQSKEARRLLSLKPDFSIGGAHDVRETVRTAAKGKVLDPKTLVEVRDTLASVRIVRNSLQKLSEQVPALWHIASGMVEQPGIEKEIGRCITSTGEIAESASPKLTALRRQLKETRQRILDKLTAMGRSKHYQDLFQEPIVTEREGRYVVPVKAEFRKDVKGIVHDVSNTGATLFVEPWATVEMGNDLRQASIEEKQEVERILGSLSSMIGVKENVIHNSIGLLAEIDLATAKARYAERARAMEPDLAVPCSTATGAKNGGYTKLRLVGARHPLLKGTAVPLDVEIGSDFSVLIITGPNTGGKTVALKTIGLLTLMTQAGMPVPASEGSSIPVFDNVFADIGDQQSIEQTLSTFSWHVGNIIRIIRNSTGNSLVLLDELGISTDPGEGAALARSLLLHFRESGTMTVATTHYADLKAFAHVTPGLQNGSMDFDLATLLPTYHLTIGIPGGSNALSIASRLGLPAEIIDVAREMMDKGSLKMDDLLASLVGERDRYRALNDGLEKDKHALEDMKVQLEAEIKKVAEEERMLLRDTRDRLLEEAAELQREIHRAEAELRKARKKEAVERGRKMLAGIEERLSGEEWQVKHDRSGDTGETGAIQAIAPGDTVRLVDRELDGVVLSLADEGKQLDIQIGNTRVTVNIRDVQKIDSMGAAVSTGYLVSKSMAGLPGSRELDLRGKRAHDISGRLDRFLNDAFLAHFKEVRIVHGYATGTVRTVVREMLNGHPLVKSFRPGEKQEGGDGVTVVQL
jgi:DNA mismatch repair protein MutS2